MNNKKPVFQQFVEANQGLLECYNKIKIEDFNKMSDAGKDSQCASHKEKIRELLNNNSLVMSALIKERIEIITKLNTKWCEDNKHMK